LAVGGPDKARFPARGWPMILDGDGIPGLGVDGVPGVDVPEFIVGIGASAGGLEALERFFKAMPVDSRMAFVVIQHLSPDFKSLMDELLARFTSMAIHRVSEPVEMRMNTIYLLPPRKEMVMEGNTLRVQDKTADHLLHLPINTFFRALARERTDRAIAIVLSGTGTDGSLGLLDVHDLGGLVLVQSQESAKFDGMPRSAAATGVANAVLAPEDMPAVLLNYSRNPAQALLDTGMSGEGGGGGLPAVFDRLRQIYDLDFNLYKPGTISRRLDRRVSLGHVATLEAYCDRVLRDPVELDSLYKDLLIGVTRFFRDPEAFTILREKVIPALVDQVPPEDEVRVWVPGCATGEEAYSLAILFLEEFERRGRAPLLKVFASDVHRDSLQTAADGVYTEAALTELPPDLLNRYFLPEPGGNYRVTGQLRKQIIFSPHNVIRDPPFTKVDLVSCRNLLIYFQPVAQMKAIGAFYFALKAQGVLFLGPSESTGDLSQEFDVLERHWKLYRKVTEHRLPAEVRAPISLGDTRGLRRGPVADARLTRAYDVLLARFVPTGVLVNERREALHFFGNADRYLRPVPGRVSHDVVNMARGDLRIALSSGLQSCLKKLEKVSFRSIHVWDEAEREVVVNLTVEPLADRVSHSTLLLVQIEEVGLPLVVIGPTTSEPVFALSEESRERIQLLESELQHTKESLQTAVEELETSNEELQASNEELLAANEELQSTNEELHSVNEELYSVNAEHEHKIRELHEVAGDLRNLMQATEIGTIFTDREQRIRLFTPAALSVFNLLAQDIGRDIRHITSRIPKDDVFDQIAKVCASGEASDARVMTPDGRTYLRRIKPYVDLNKDAGGLILTFVDVTRLSEAETALRESERQFRLIFESAPDGILTADVEGRVVHANERVHRIFGYENGDLVGRLVEELMPAAVRGAHRQHREAHLGQGGATRAMGLDRDFPGLRRDGTEFRVEVGLSPVEIGGKRLMLAFVTDVTQRKEAESRRLRIEAKMIETAKLESLGVLAGGIAHDFNNLLTGILGSASLAAMELAKLGEHPSLRQSIRLIEEASQRAGDLCKQLLAYSGKGKFVVESLNLTVLVEQTIELVRASVSKHVELQFELDRDVPSVVMDATQIRQVVMNLVINASEAIGDQLGRIRVTTGVRHVETADLRMALGAEGAAEGDYVSLTVSDSGCGIAPEDMAKIFEPFFTTKFTGRGLGLSAVVGIIRGHRGLIRLQSRPGVGTTFEVLLPPSSRPVESVHRRAAPPAGWRGSGTVLVVDDEPAVRITSGRLLQALGFEVVMAVDGVDAVDIFGREPSRFAAVLLDLTMPRMNGEETFASLRRIRPDTRVVLMSGFNQDEATARFVADDLAGFLAKPFTSDALSTAMQTAMRR
jgi:two-component system CheB/CheR fusion protein